MWLHEADKKMAYDILNLFHSVAAGKTYPTPQIFPIYEGDPLSPPEGEAAQGVRPFDPHVNQRF
jgi:hypothetical protein